MKEIKTEIIINSKPEKVWNILTNFEKYPEWNPFIKSISIDSEIIGISGVFTLIRRS